MESRSQRLQSSKDNSKFTLKLVHGGRIKNLGKHPTYLGGFVEFYEDLEVDEFGLIVLKEKLQELGYNNKEPRFYVYSQIGLKQLESDSDIWASATDLNMFRELELWIDFNKIHNEDTDDGDMSNGEDFSLSGYDSDEILDDNDYELNKPRKKVGSNSHVLTEEAQDVIDEVVGHLHNTAESEHMAGDDSALVEVDFLTHDGVDFGLFEQCTPIEIEPTPQRRN
nr:uncharacterized protein LOC109188831 [Ipomoea batatas]